MVVVCLQCESDSFRLVIGPAILIGSRLLIAGYGYGRKWCFSDVEEEGVTVGFGREDALCRSEWSVSVNHISAG